MDGWKVRRMVRGNVEVMDGKEGGG